jgi:hypothetical protein
MRIGALLAVLALLLSVITANADKPPVIKDSEAIQYVGKEVEVRGRSASYHDPRENHRHHGYNPTSRRKPEIEILSADQIIGLDSRTER